jgi:dolichyl-diphosphooligosaccharide--protein glycosyltransferase
MGVMMTPLQMNFLTHSEAEYQAAAFMDDYAAAQDWEYPDNYVFSQWGENRMYNALVSGESRSYGYARSNYETFLTATASGEWYDRLQPRRFVVTKTLDGTEWEPPAESMYARLHLNDGAGTGHYRLVFQSGDGSVKVFSLVEGAQLQGTVPANASADGGRTSEWQVSTTVELPSGETVTYSRMVTPDSSGEFQVRVAQPGEYTIGDRSVVVSDAAVVNGSVVSLNRSS